MFWDFGSLFRTFRRHFLTRCCGSRIFVHVVAETSAWCRGTSQRNIAFCCFRFSRRCGVVYHTQEIDCETNASHTQGSVCEINASHTQGAAARSTPLTISRRQHVMARPRASRSSSHRDERWEGCRV